MLPDTTWQAKRPEAWRVGTQGADAQRTVLVTGAAGFIGAHLARRLLLGGDTRVVGIDNLSDYYDPALKRERIDMLFSLPGGAGERFEFLKADIAEDGVVEELVDQARPDVVVHLAAQAGVRHSIDDPGAYVRNNVVGFLNVLEACRAHPVGHLVYASSSSVYGNDATAPFSTTERCDAPVSLYAATKRSDELMAHAYSHLYGIPATGLRFFTVYGPMGRPDMAYFSFAMRMAQGKPISLFNHGDLRRDFTYVDDTVEGLCRVIDAGPWAGREGRASSGAVPHRIYNIGRGHPVQLFEFVSTLEGALAAHGVIDAPARIELAPMQPGDVFETFADTSDFERDFGFSPQTTLEEGLDAFAEWFATWFATRNTGREEPSGSQGA